MGVQEIIAGAIVAAALAYVGQMIYKRSGLFSKKAGCQDDCGCSGTSRRTHTSA